MKGFGFLGWGRWLQDVQLFWHAKAQRVEDVVMQEASLKSSLIERTLGFPFCFLLGACKCMKWSMTVSALIVFCHFSLEEMLR
jgi:hypothetical protein